MFLFLEGLTIAPVLRYKPLLIIQWIDFNEFFFLSVILSWFISIVFLSVFLPWWCCWDVALCIVQLLTVWRNLFFILQMFTLCDSSSEKQLFHFSRSLLIDRCTECTTDVCCNNNNLSIFQIRNLHNISIISGVILYRQLAGCH